MSQAKKEFSRSILVERVVTKFAGEFTPAEWAAHKKEHPGADVSDHTIVKPESGEKKPEAESKGEKPEEKPKRKVQTELEFLRDMIDNPKDNGLDPKDPEDKKTLENAQKQLNKALSQRGEGAPTKKEREDAKPVHKQVKIHPTTADSLARHYTQKTRDLDLSSWTGGRKTNPVVKLINRTNKGQAVDHEDIHDALDFIRKQRAGEGRESARKELDHVKMRLKELAAQLK